MNYKRKKRGSQRQGSRQTQVMPIFNGNPVRAHSDLVVFIELNFFV